MKKILTTIMVAVVAATTFIGCTPSGDDSGYLPDEEFTGTLKITVFNNSNTTLTIDDIKVRSDIYSSTYGSISESVSINPNENKEFKIDCKITGSASFGYSAKEFMIGCYYKSGSTIVKPYVANISGSSITYSGITPSTTESKWYEFYPSLSLKTSSPETKSLTMSFVKDDENDRYALCLVK